MGGCINLRKSLAALDDMSGRDADDLLGGHDLDPGRWVVLHQAVEDVNVFAVVDLKRHLSTSAKIH